MCRFDELSVRVSEQEQVEANLREELMSAVRRADFERITERLNKAEAELVRTSKHSTLTHWNHCIKLISQSSP
jgi:hypothetical protein